ncbi:MAG TPA: 4Fe-4S binding protein, partial [Deferrisomatales bacterium]|nr:4Fe-4S binding protein [Deferrisomatales bacterium]
MKRQAKQPFDRSKIPDDLCPIASATDPLDVNTGDWRARRPVIDRGNCVKCGTCWLYCPTQCIRERPRWFESNLAVCKGCGVCAQECPHRAIIMIE